MQNISSTENTEGRPLVSVIVPVYNCEKYIRKCLLSIAQNSYQSLEIICVDDGSTDHSLAIAKEIAGKDSRMTVIEKENGGVSSARNAGLQYASGPFISFVDADDWLHLSFFDTLMPAFSENTDIVICDMINVDRHIDDAVIENAEITEYTARDALRIRNAYTYATGRIYRRECFQGLQFNESIAHSEDLLFNHQILPGCKIIKWVHALLYYRFVRMDSMIHTIDPKDALPVMKAFIELAEGEKGPETVLLKRAYRSMLSGRYKNHIGPSSEEYPGMMELIIRLKKQGRRLPIGDRLLFNTLLDHPLLFRWLSAIRKRLRAQLVL